MFQRILSDVPANNSMIKSNISVTFVVYKIIEVAGTSISDVTDLSVTLVVYQNEVEVVADLSAV